MPVPADTLFVWHTRSGAFRRLVPPWITVERVRWEGIRDGQQAILKLRNGPIRATWIATHHDYREGQQFCDTQAQGPFRRWTHTHRMEPDGPDSSMLIDHLEYELPMGRIGEVFGASFVQNALTRAFAYRHRVTAHDLMLHQRYNPDGRVLRIAVSGASGLIGSNLVAFLSAGGHEVVSLVRRPPAREGEIHWDYRTGTIDLEQLEGLDALIHLAGEPVFALRWNEQKKTRIYESRVKGTQFISETLSRLRYPPPVFISASGIGYYGNQGIDVVTEVSARGNGFLATVTHDWEAATRPAVEAGIRTASLRIGAVLSPQGGALKNLLRPLRLGLGGRIRTHDQYVSWIVLDDVLGAIYHILMTDIKGPVNLTAPHPVTMKTLVKTLARVVRRPALFAMPPSLVRRVCGEVAEEVMLMSTHVGPTRLQETGYAFAYPDLEVALCHQLGFVR